MIADAQTDFCYVTTTGRNTGAPHRIEIWFAAATDRDTIYLLAGGRDRSDWVRNLQAHPSCTVEINGARYDGTARMVEGTNEDEIARTLVHDKYATGDDLQEWRAAALPVAIDVIS
ncbi:MAG TPA: nitroreductase family deazaflavin-dependent oxidoreductase [Acidimicrobiia bacterium]|nr:nitroreductase family deazaflavin-dependent oxidoreductase [Acidimicrobiia bacterium]